SMTAFGILMPVMPYMTRVRVVGVRVVQILSVRIYRHGMSWKAVMRRKNIWRASYTRAQVGHRRTSQARGVATRTEERPQPTRTLIGHHAAHHHGLMIELPHGRHIEYASARPGFRV